MKANEVDVADAVRIIRGDWTNQVGTVTHKSELLSVSGEQQKALLTIRLETFPKSIQKNNFDIEKIASAQ
ncbi:MAG: hypothetical protein A3C08_02620 [Candidatus Taylorbacteria bacterium RIFCSPHIGHO2_02_FULL_47_18]|uniref:Uncharacterized protein n=1 Tax=Candidatus Taylorbacteria bacterium RIFCSPLOWO2_01_FULL_48_100 TaxID=1802322 RepID=A0A1G2NDY6_9BACT|nr:MAG: hypothetical protein A2670_02330 [Candidatus Taylorbacteria bacterium RIFCSPHIGHO2_01_FULL_48_38]OHA27594.1 MAG: hypothetical protein A3C08_02620 [Candidatus Taylorbacteria bacterium RIFCSPHIGHO2_02_FULL_47_18]OHA34286.1 MAG: hypothetical protein A2938_02005 [Candidatus Taylorbacteria bacterium RIFCSPLOWO2_01_FULL_48_100]OHA40440.1 MAG: hypothetical protein A3J31_02640 [Candidatus Taylorbacteria bacterium RIFCSPLOWO2_02_FULL_48_16]OHA44920.1 MAG: hypothetical protein A3H13_03385 [Candid